MSADVVVVGGGIWGASTAFHLAQRGTTRVVVLERNFDLAQETTINAAGMIGQIRSSPALTRGIAYALDLFERFPAEYGCDPGLVQCGSLFVGLTPERAEYFSRQIEAGRRNGLTIDALAPSDVGGRLEGLETSRIAAAYFVHGDGYIDPARAARSLAAAAEARGVEFRFGVQATGVRIESSRVLGVETKAGFEPAGAVVLTAGPWTAALARKAGLDLAVQPIRHQRVRTVPWPESPKGHPVVRLPDLSSYVRPDGRRLVVGHFESEPTAFDLEGSAEGLHTADIDPPVELMARAIREVASIYPKVGTLAAAEYRRGLVTFAPDASYMFGPAPEVSGLYAASGCAALGVAGGPAVGKWLAEWIVDGRPREDLSEFDLSRIGGLTRDQLRAAATEAYARYYAVQH